MKQIVLGLTMMVLIGIQSCKTDKVSKIELPQEIIDNDWDKAVQLSKERNKPILIDFYASWCKYCAKFKENTLNNPEVKDYISKNYIPIVIDIEKGKGVELKEKYGVNSFPLHLIVDVNLQEKGREYGNMPPTEFLTWVKSVK